MHVPCLKAPLTSTICDSSLNDFELCSTSRYKVMKNLKLMYSHSVVKLHEVPQTVAVVDSDRNYFIQVL